MQVTDLVIPVSTLKFIRLEEKGGRGGVVIGYHLQWEES